MLNREHCKINYSGLMGELSTMEKEYLHLLPSKLTKQYKGLQAAQQAFKEDLVFNAAARMVRLLHVNYLKLLNTLKENSPTSNFLIKDIFEHTPLMIPSKVPGKVYVFPHLIVDKVQEIDLRNVCWVVCFDSLQSFNAIRAKKPNSWKPFFRGWRKIKKYEELSLIRALSRYTHIKSALNYDELCALEAAYVESIKPLELIYAKEPKDYIAMFKEGGASSCMTTTGNKEDAWRDILKQKHHPMSLFSYHPYIRGVYCIKNNSVVARTLLYNVNTNQWQYGRIHAVNGLYASKFAELLQKSDYEELKKTFSKKVSFTVPGIRSKDMDDYILPVPYMDNVAPLLHGAFDTETKEFTVAFNCSKPNRNISCTSTGGYIRASSLISVKCSRCGETCTEIHSSWDGKKTFCTKPCAQSAGYIYARTANGELQLRPAVTCYHDFLISRVFTNLNSCKRNGGKRVLHSVDVKSDEIIAIQETPERFSTGGYNVVCMGKVYCVGLSLYSFLITNTLFTVGDKLKCSKGIAQ